MAEKSGLDMISELLTEVKLLRQEVKILDQNIKKIANSAKVAELVAVKQVTPIPAPKPQIAAVSADEVKSTNNKMKFKFEGAQNDKPTMCVCEGKMVAEYQGKSVPLADLVVKIFNDKDDLVKTTKTNRAGSWVSHLPVGKYVANIEGKYNGKDLYPVNLRFIVQPGMKKLEVK